MSRMAVSFVQGLRGNHSSYVKVTATCKHFLAYSLETWGGVTRHDYDAQVDERRALACVAAAHA